MFLLRAAVIVCALLTSDLDWIATFAVSLVYLSGELSNLARMGELIRVRALVQSALTHPAQDEPPVLDSQE
jgi:hypothetical protein